MDPTGRSERINRAGRRVWGTNYGDPLWVQYEPLSGGSIPLAGGIFRSSYMAVDPDTNTEVQAQQPMLIVETHLLPAGAPEEGAHFVIGGPGGGRFRVFAIEPEPEGTVRVFLRKA